MKTFVTAACLSLSALTLGLAAPAFAQQSICAVTESGVNLNNVMMELKKKGVDVTDVSDCGGDTVRATVRDGGSTKFVYYNATTLEEVEAPK